MNCKKGDMARIVHSPFLPSALRQIVECVDLTLASPEFPDVCPAPFWLCRIAFPERVFSPQVPRETFRAEVGSLVVIPDAWLRPIRPGDEEVDATEEASNALPNVMAPRRQVEFSR
ncbi:hypothetical protein [Rhizobacter sp. OV335]|uniref:hypothetical protein n=1 Tax=Rhizobacter sp. OV335 TaxID=1500264 RepID=UPI000923FD04|nr:hypothetical protein [Rhizobacter sp. OV335]SHN40514.1 hypothetical protein SAMN02787076_06269 [Rhizobacter sp. OV335]